MNHVPIFRSAITGEDGQVDAGYLALFWVLVLVVGAIPVMCAGTLAAMYFDAKHVFKAQELGVGIGAVCTGFAAAIGGVGLFRAGDKHHPTQPSSTTTISTPGQEVKQVITPTARSDEDGKGELPPGYYSFSTTTDSRREDAAPKRPMGRRST